MTFPLKIVGLLKSSVTPAVLVGEWLFNNNVLDSSGNGYDGILDGGTYVNDRNGNSLAALSIPGGEFDRVRILNAPLLNFSDNFGISFWLYSRSAGFYVVAANNVNNGWGAWQHTRPAMSIGGTVGANFIRATIGFPSNTWMHFAANYIHATKTVDLYLNGTLNISGASADFLGDGGDDVWIGQDLRSGTLRMNAIIDTLGLYTGNLTPAQIATLATF